ncbi:EVE domain-containing protein [Thermodesulfovibrio yellowstonii]|uniref:EVE domain-containing protein n=1 Tax=Thermodesulfovibrio yellowstonii TaxID=28262 RepID=UPI0035A21C40
MGFRKKKKPSIRQGDYIFFYAPGGSKKIFALAEAVCDPEININYNPQEEGSCYWIVRLKYLINIPVNSGINIKEIITNERDLLKSIQRQSHIRLTTDESKLAFEKLGYNLRNNYPV